MSISNERPTQPEVTEAYIDGVLSEALPIVLGNMSRLVTTHTNHVYVLPPISVIKIPLRGATHTDAPALLGREAEVVDFVADSAEATGIKPHVEIPRLLAFSGQTSRHDWVAFSYVAGEVLDRRYIWEHFSTPDYQSLGRRACAFTFDMSSAVNPAEFREALEDYDHCVVDREALFRSALGKLGLYEDMGYRQLAAFIRGCGREYGELQAQREAAPAVFIQDDLHDGNLLFIPTKRPDDREQWELSGVIDFALAKLGPAARNFCMHPEAPQAALEMWQDLARDQKTASISEWEVRLCANIQCAVSCTSSIDSFGMVVPYTLKSMEHVYPETEFSAAAAKAKRAKGNSE